jgi:aspartyl-tRNA(Asn)/glutamyl-tRNA(Gln) amidotransferase subunit A
MLTQDHVTTNGSTIMAENVPDADATVIARLRAAGTVLLGKLNMSEYASGDAFRHPYGRPRNPWDTGRNPGTSSSGSGAATAAFLCATSLGEDTGGSIRGPAAFCGLVGIRPTFGRVSRHGVFGASWSMDTVGPISRTVTDCANTLEAIAGHDPNDPQTWDVPVPNYSAALDGNIAGLKVGLVTERVHTDANDPEVRDAVIKAAGLLAGLGAEVSEVSVPLIVNSSEISYGIISSDAAMLNWDIISTERLGELDHNNQVRLLMGSIVPAKVYQKATRLRDVLRRQILAALGQVDVLVMPASSVPATLIPQSAGLGTKADVLAGFKGRRGFTAPFNLANLPALSINCGFTSSGLPIGLQIAGALTAQDFLAASVAKQRGLKHGTHRTMVNSARQIADEMDDNELRLELGMGILAAQHFHSNFYNGTMEPEDVEYARPLVHRFVAQMLALLD